MNYEPQVILSGPINLLERLAMKLAREGVGRHVGVFRGKPVISIVGAGDNQLRRILDDAVSMGITEVIDKEEFKDYGQARRGKRTKHRRKVAA